MGAIKVSGMYVNHLTNFYYFLAPLANLKQLATHTQLPSHQRH
ncbi:hypothetical protein SynSYN20_00913 [Synechococcus sp. SYN20]|nr:hypothetical protein SynSYN20_00913 [Synechococcus sp. SYN20]